MDNKMIIAPSILAADFSRLGEEIQDVEKGGCDIIHVDVMDGSFVPNISIGPLVVKAAKKVAKKPLDVHLMIEDPIRYIDEFRKAGSDWITIHVESTDKVGEALDKIKESGAKVGLSLRPGTPVSVIEPYLDRVDLVLVMSVEPGFGGQSFMADQMDKVKALKSNPHFNGLVSVDGGVNAETASQVREAGADILVAGTAVFGCEDRAKAINNLRM